MKKKILFFAFFFSSLLFALDVPNLSGCINDYAGILKSNEKENLEVFLRHINKASKVQIALLTISSLEGNSIEYYSIKVAEAWKLGDAKESSGAILIISKEDRKIRIEVGYGLEKDLTDAVCNQIINKIIAPSFKQGDYYKGINNALHAIASYALKDESLIKDSVNKKRIEKDKKKLPFKLWKLFTILFILYILICKRTGNFFWPLFIFSNTFGYDRKYRSNKKSAKWTPFDSSSGSFLGGSSFGSFSSDDKDNFSGNGGSFGGGGASGGW